MTGIPEYNIPAFLAAEEQLKHLGTIINPAKIKPKEETWEGYMRADIAELMKCDTVYLLPGWEKSRGAQIEVYLAKALGMEIHEYTKQEEQSA